MSKLIACPQCGTTELRTQEGLCATCLLEAGLADSGLFQEDSRDSLEAGSELTTGESPKAESSGNDFSERTAATGVEAGQRDWDQSPTIADSATEEDSHQELNPESEGIPVDATAEFGSGELSLEFLTPSNKPGCLGTLGVYEIVAVIGRGGFGIVLKGIDPNLNRVVAIKVLVPDLATDPTARKRFLREARSAAAVNHANVVEIHEVDDKALLPFLVMEYVDGLTLGQRIQQQGPLGLEEILRIGSQTAAGLAAAHAQGLIHRDIKPGNILLPKTIDRAKITDFGLARTAEDVRLTRTGTLAGTPQYMSPEQAEGEDLDPRSDLFSLGSVLYAMCTGTPPFRGDNTVAVLRAVCAVGPVPVTKKNRRLPKWLAEIVARLMAKKPADRFQSAAEVAELLEQHLAHVQNPKTTPRPSRVGPTRTAKPRRRGWLVGAAVLLVVFGCLALTEATGVTGVVNFTATVLRIQTPDGTLVVEVNDPNIKIEVTGEGDVVIRGAGPQELRLKPGQYQVKATGNGATRTQGITIEQGGRQILRVHLEPAVAANQANVQQKPANVLPGQQSLHLTFKNSIGMEFVLVPKGKSWLGGGNGKVGEQEVQVPADFYLGKYEVTQEEWAQVMEEDPSHFSRTGAGKDAVKDIPDADLKRFPVENVSWDQCQLFVAKLNELEKGPGWSYRLPTAAEWEYACRSGPMSDKQNSAFAFYFASPTNTLLPELANFGKELNRPCKVGSYQPNPLGLHDMHGNAFEWCDDGTSVTSRSMKGGSWASDSINTVSAAFPGRTAIGARINSIGLRLARVPSGTPLPEVKTPPPAVAPFPDADVQRIAALPADKQVEEVRKELMRLNPGFDGQVQHKIEGGVVTELTFVTDHVSDISPVQALQELNKLVANGSSLDKNALTDLSPLKGLRLSSLRVVNSKVSDLSPLKGMPLVQLDFWSWQGKDLSPLKGMPLTALDLAGSQVSDLSPLQGMPLTSLNLHMCSQIKDLTPLQGMKLTHLNLHDGPRVSDLAPLQGMPLTDLRLGRNPVQDLSPLRGMPLTALAISHCRQLQDYSPLRGMKLTLLYLDDTPILDLSPLKGMPLEDLYIHATGVTDLTPLQGMRLKNIRLTPKNITQGLDILRDMKSLNLIGLQQGLTWPAAEFWARHDKGEFKN